MASTIDPQVLAADGITTDRLRELLDQSPPDQAEALLSRTLECMAEHYQGDEAGMASVPSTLAAEEIVDLLDRQEVLVGRHRMEEEIEEEEEEVDFLSEDEDFLIEELIDEEVTYVEEEERKEGSESSTPASRQTPFPNRRSRQTRP